MQSAQRKSRRKKGTEFIVDTDDEDPDAGENEKQKAAEGTDDEESEHDQDSSSENEDDDEDNDRSPYVRASPIRAAKNKANRKIDAYIGHNLI